MTGKNHNNCNYRAAFETYLRVAALLSVLHVLIYFVCCTDFFFYFFFSFSEGDEATQEVVTGTVTLICLQFQSNLFTPASYIPDPKIP